MTAGPSVVLVLSRWHDPLIPLELVFEASDVPDLRETNATGTVRLVGKADLGRKEIVVDFEVECRTREICARSLEEFEHPLRFPFHLLLRRKAHLQEPEWSEEEEGDEVFVVAVPEESRELDITEALRQAIELERPLSPIRPGVDLPDGVQPEEAPEKDPTDPRWDALRRLKRS